MPPGYTEDELSEVDPKNEPLKIYQGPSTPMHL